MPGMRRIEIRFRSISGRLINSRKSIAPCGRLSLCRFRNKTSDEQHNAPLCLHKRFRKTHYHGIDLRRRNRLHVLPDMQPPAVYDLRNLFSPQPAVAFSQNIQNRLFNFHFRLTKCSNLSYKMSKTTLLLNSQEKHREGFRQCQ